MVSKSHPEKNPFVGRMTDPTAGAWITGPCGDTMEIYLVINDGIIETIRYHTDGCRFTHLCGSTLAQKVQGCPIHEALSVNPTVILEELGDQLPSEHRHCAILAVSTLYRAIGQYWIDWAKS